MASCSLRIRRVDETWDAPPRHRVEGIRFNGNAAGPDTCSFNLRRDDAGGLPDLTPGNWIEIYKRGILRWEGRIADVPVDIDERTVSVQGKGWQYHMDDDVDPMFLVHTRLSEWKDIRSHLSADLSYWRSGPQVEVGDGGIVITWPNGTPVVTSTGAGVLLDTGAANAKRVVVTFATNIPSGYYDFYARGADDIATLLTAGGYGDAIAVDAGSSSPRSGTLSTKYRYITLFLWRKTTGTTTGEDYFKITSAQVFSDTAYESGNTSILEADEVVKLARARCPLFSTDETLIADCDFSIPDFAYLDARTPRQHCDAANAYHDWRLQLHHGRRLRFEAKPTAPKYRVGAWPGSQFKDSTISGEDIYNRVLVTGDGPDGQKVTVERLSSQQTQQSFAKGLFANPTAAVDASDWNGTNATISRDTGVYDTSPAAIKATYAAANPAAYTTSSVAIVAGKRYRVTARVRHSAAGYIDYQLKLGSHWSKRQRVASATWTTITVDLIATVSENAILTVQLWGSANFYIDSVSPVYEVVGTIPDRQGYVHGVEFPVQAGLTQAVGERFGDLVLANKSSAPFRGELVISPGGLRPALGGHVVDPADVSWDVGEVIRFTDRLDPDTGGHGRDGRIAAYAYDDDTEEVTIAIDNESRRVDALVSRYAAVVG